ncbi:MAG: PAS domain S-box protein [Ardenticatenaceae bacterium]|nr:PAS domain S-box protein [Ardenticatenaceae bacterium]
MNTRLLYFEQQPEMIDLVQQEIQKGFPDCGWQVVKTRPEFLEALSAAQQDLIITAFHLPQYDALALLADVKKQSPHTPVIVFTQPVNEATAVACLKAGAVDYLTTDQISDLGTAVRQALQKKEQAQQSAALIENSEWETEAFIKKSQILTQIGTYGFDVKTGQWESSSTFDQILGIDQTYPRDIDGWKALVHPAYQAKIHQQLTEFILEGNTEYENEYPIIRPSDGEERWIYTERGLEFNEKGKAVKMIGTVQDITQRKQTEEALRDSEYFLRKTQSVAKIGSYVLDFKTGLYTVSETTDVLFGIDATYPRGLPGWTDIVHPDYREELLNYTNQHVLRDHNRFDYKYPIIRQNDKQLRWVHGLAEVELDENGEAIRLVGTIQDITSQHQAEEALQLTRFTVDNVADAVYWITREAKFIDVNETACKQLGYTREEMLKLSIGDVDPNFVEDDWIPNWKKSQKLTKRIFETQHKTKEGVLFPVEVVTNYLIFNGEELSCAVVRDITTRKVAEAELHKSEERLQKFSAVTNEGILFHHNGIIRDANDSLRAMFGYQLEEVIGRSLLDFIPAEEHALVLQKVAEKEEQPYESLGKRKDGTVFPVETIARELEFRGEHLRVASLRDITERKQAELERLENLKFFENLDRINRTFQKADDIDRLMIETLDEVLSIFNCDRAYLMYPVDLEVSTLEVRMERTTSEYPGAFEINKLVPLAPQLKQIIRQFSRDGQPSQLVEGKELDPEQEPWKSYSIKSILAIPLYPKVGKPWMFGLHQCAYAREWTTAEEKLFQAISRRLADALTAMLVNQELRESEARYREAQRIAQMGHWTYDPYARQPLWWSEETFRLHGLDPAQNHPTNEQFFAQIHPDDQAIFREYLTRTLQTGEPLAFEYRTPLGNGEFRTLEARGIAHLDANQQIALLTGTVLDITKQKQAAERLRYQAILLQNINDAIIASDLEYNITSWNEAAEALYGWSADEAVGKSFPELVPVRLVEESAKFPSQVLLKEGKWQGELLHQHKDGSELHILASTALIVDDNNQPTGIVTVNRDITERKQIEAALQQSEERLRQAIQVANIGTFDHDHINDFIYFSPELRQMWDLPSSQDVRLDSLDFEKVHPDDRERVLQAMAEAHSPSGDGSFEIEQRLVHSDQSVHWISVRSRTFFAGEGEERHPVRTIGAVVDLTEAKLAEESRAKLEEQLRQAQKLESLGRLAGGIAHDFNNLLVPMIGYTELGQMRLSADNKAHAYFEKIGNAATRAADLTKQILAFSRRQMLEMGLFDLNDVVGEFRDMLERLIGEDIQMKIFLAPTPCPITADRTQIEQILMNLVLNARDAMPTGGQLIVETDTVFLDESYVRTHPDTTPGHYAMLSISDTGLGMDSETQQSMFDPFFTTKERGKGTGLGLATVFGIVKQHGGNIWVYSEPNEGTTFKIYLPRPEDATQLSSAIAPEMPTVYGTETVLVVEDEPMVRRLACETLATYGYNVLEGENPFHGIKIADTHPEKIDLLLTDVIMPEMNGRELHDKLLNIRPDIKVLFMSGYTDNVIVHHGVLDEGVNFLEKPFTIRHFIQKVRRVLDE